MFNSDDYYEILQVSPSAQPEIIEAAYRRLMQLYHPDVNKTSEANRISQEINNAYDTLKDPAKRAAYDRQRGTTSRTQSPPPRRPRSSASQQRQSPRRKQRKPPTSRSRNPTGYAKGSWNKIEILAGVFFGILVIMIAMLVILDTTSYKTGPKGEYPWQRPTPIPIYKLCEHLPEAQQASCQVRRTLERLNEPRSSQFR